MRSRLLTATHAVPAALLGALMAAAPAQAVEQLVPTTAGGLSPQVLEVAAGEPLPGATAGPLPQPAPLPAAREAGAGPGRLENPPTLRALGLPSALAAVLAGGVASLLVRLLLAEPAARRRTRW